MLIRSLIEELFSSGTTVLASNLFKNLPVRKQYYNTSKKKKDELKKVEDLVTSYAVIRHDVRFTLRHNKELLWQVWWMWFFISQCQKSKCPKMYFGINWSVGTEQFWIPLPLYHPVFTGNFSPIHWVRPVMKLGYLSSSPHPHLNLYESSVDFEPRSVYLNYIVLTVILQRLSSKDCLKF